MSAVLDITDDTFAAEVKTPGKLVLVDFWAPWCAHCRALAPHLAVVADMYGDTVAVRKYNIEEGPQIALDAGVSSLPTVIVYRDGRIAGMRSGPISKAQLIALVEDCLPAAG